MIDPKVYRLYARISGAVFTKIFLMVVAYFVGRKLDEQFGTFPLFMVVLMVIAVGAGLWWIIRIADRG